MSIRDLADRLAVLGLPLRATDDATASIPQEPYPVLALKVPSNASAALKRSLLDVEGEDPTDPDGNAAEPVAALRVRRALHRLRDRGVITAWHAFQDGADVWVHLQFDAAKARAFFRAVDWSSATAETSTQRPTHRWL